MELQQQKELIKKFRPGMKFKLKNQGNVVSLTLIEVYEGSTDKFNVEYVESCKEDYGRGLRPYISKRNQNRTLEDFLNLIILDENYLEQFRYKNLWEENRWNRFHLYAGSQGWECHWNVGNQNFDKPWRTRDADANEELKNKLAYKKYVETSCLTKDEANDFYNRVSLKIWREEFKDNIKPGRNAYQKACWNNNYLTDREAHALFYNM